VPMMLLKVRVELAARNYAAAARWLRTGFAFSQHVGEGPFLINKLVGIALADQFLDAALEFVEQPESPNLYWALSKLPEPLIDLRKALDLEHHVVEMEFPGLADLDRPRPPEEWDSLLKKIRTEVENLTAGGNPKET